jgi:hypothetical protein
MKLIPTAALTLLLAACATPAAPTGAPRADTPSTVVSPTAAGAPGAAPGVAPADQGGAIDCGVVIIPQGQGLSETAMACVVDAAKARRPARLEETRPTIEGDPIFTTYVVRADGTVEVIRDTSKDKFGANSITKEICTGPVADRGMLTFADCTPAK